MAPVIKYHVALIVPPKSERDDMRKLASAIDMRTCEVADRRPIIVSL